MSKNTNASKIKNTKDKGKQPSVPAKNVPPFLKAIQDLDTFKSEVMERLDSFDARLIECERRINSYDEFFGAPPKVIPESTAQTPTVSSTPNITVKNPENDMPAHIKEELKKHGIGE